MQLGLRGMENSSHCLCDRIREGMDGALDRMDSCEERILKEQFRRVEERAKEAEEDGNVVRERLSRTVEAFQVSWCYVVGSTFIADPPFEKCFRQEQWVHDLLQQIMP